MDRLCLNEWASLAAPWCCHSSLLPGVHPCPLPCIHALTTSAPAPPPQAVCEMITTAGGRVSKSERQETRKKLDDVMSRLERIGSEKGVAARIRFVIKDIMVCVCVCVTWWPGMCVDA